MNLAVGVVCLIFRVGKFSQSLEFQVAICYLGYFHQLTFRLFVAPQASKSTALLQITTPSRHIARSDKLKIASPSADLKLERNHQLEIYFPSFVNDFLFIDISVYVFSIFSFDVVRHELVRKCTWIYFTAICSEFFSLSTAVFLNEFNCVMKYVEAEFQFQFGASRFGFVFLSKHRILRNQMLHGVR